MKNLPVLLFAFICSSFQLSAQVEYLNIDIENINIGNLLTWTTTSEVDNAQFSIEKSTDGQTFVSINTLEGQINSEQETEYTFLDTEVKDFLAFYRLRAIALDGTFSYSQVLQVQQDFSNNLLVEHVSDMSNPNNKDFLYLELTVSKAGLLTYSIEKENLTVISPVEQFVENGLIPLSIDFSSLSKGHYTIKLKLENEVELILIDRTDDASPIQVTAGGVVNEFVKYRNE